MATSESPHRYIPQSVGCAGAMIFLVAMLQWIFTHPDPQSSIGIALSPFYAAWFGVSVGLIAAGVQNVVRRDRTDSRSLRALNAVPFIVVGVIGSVLVCGVIAGEIYQQLHPDQVGDNPFAAHHTARE